MTVFGQHDHARDVHTGLSVVVKWTLLTEYVLVYVCLCGMQPVNMYMSAVLLPNNAGFMAKSLPRQAAGDSCSL